MRLFAAVLPPAAVIAELAAAVEALRSLPGAGRLRWSGRESLHLTLAFYGEVGEELLPELSTRLERAARRTEPFALRLRGGGHFGGGALWAGAAGGLGTLRLLAERTDAAGRRTGVPMERHRTHHPHLTIARGRGRGADPADLRPYAEALAGFESTEWQVTELVLMRSRLPVSGVPGERPRHEPQARWALGPPDAGDRDSGGSGSGGEGGDGREDGEGGEGGDTAHGTGGPEGPSGSGDGPEGPAEGPGGPAASR
jgi:RNA 2',3'-cyclic 3'-phosphodiesterase